MARKTFFRERTVAEERDLRARRASSQRHLVDKVTELDPAEEVLEIRAQLIPGRFFRNVETSAEASRKALKHGDYLSLSHPQTREDCRRSPLIPLQIRAYDFRRLEAMREEDINFVGYSVRPNWADRMKRVTPFAFLPEGLKIFAYAETLAGGIKVEPYADAKRVARDGADVVVGVPSRTEKHQRYKYRIVHVPVIRSPDNLAAVLAIRPMILQDDETGEGKKGRTEHETYFVRYTWETESESGPMIVTYPHDIAAYLGIVKHELKTRHNMNPMTMNPHALFSRRGVEFAKKLDNNVLVYDPSLKSKHKLRKPHLAEKSILLARAIGRFGHDEIAFWEPERDGMLRDYDWGVGKS